MDMKLLSHLVASLTLLVLCCGAGAVKYSGHGESDKMVFSGLHRHTRQAIEIRNGTTTTDNHAYYTSTFYPPGSAQADNLWIELSSLSDSEIIPESGISQSFRVFDAHLLPFDFEFYGHTINLVAVTTGGFLYTSDYLHSQIHLTQYIAPLQADFDPSRSTSARVLIHSSSERFTVQWDRVRIVDHIDEGEFTFQVSLLTNGTIHFVYRNMPLAVSNISDEEHPVEVGLADSFYVDRPIPPNLILRQVFEYSRIQLSQDNLNFSAYVLEPLPGCVTERTCQSCVNASMISTFACGWCTVLNRCSDGIDRFRQEWFESGCVETATTSCPGPVTTTEQATTASEDPDTTTTVGEDPTKQEGTTTMGKEPTKQERTTTVGEDPRNQAMRGASDATLSSGAIAGISVGLTIVSVLVVLIVVVALGLLIYGYRHPTSSIGLFMIEHRPKARSLNKSKASYEVDSGKTTLETD